MTDSTPISATAQLSQQVHTAIAAPNALPPTDTTNTAQTLRDYQQQAILAVRAAWLQNKTPLASLATGLGKTTVFSQLLVEEINPERQRALVLAHTQELIYQPFQRISNQFGDRLKRTPYFGVKFAPGIGIVMGTQDSPDARIVVATRQSLHKRRLEQVLEAGKIDVVIIDESHHVSADNTYWQIIKQLREHNPAVRIAGFTATPKRTDRKALGVLFDEICFEYGILSAIKDGWLVPPTRIRVKTPVDTSEIETVKGDYNQKKLISVLDANNWITLAVEAYRQYIEKAGRPALAFFPEVAMSQAFTARLRAAGVAAAHIDANTPKADRANILRDFQAGALKVVSNCAVLTEGFDAPSVAAILLARPTRSDVLLTQILGRGLRLYPGKHDCLVVDLTVADTKALEIGTLLGKMQTCHVCETEFYRGFKSCPHCGAAVVTEPGKKQEELDLAGGGIRIKSGKGQGTNDFVEEVVSLFDGLAAAWHKGTDEYYSCSVGSLGALVIVPPTYGDSEPIRRRMMRGLGLVQGGTFAGDAEPLGELKYQIGMLERMLKRSSAYSLYYAPSKQQDKPKERVRYLRANEDLSSLMIEADIEVLKLAGSKGKSLSTRSANWRLRDASPAQRDFLRRLGAHVPEELSSGAAAEQITHILSVRDVRSWIDNDTLSEPEDN